MIADQNKISLASAQEDNSGQSVIDIPNVWPSTPTARNMKLFAQLVVHKTSVTTFEAFRAMSLDTVSRVREAKEVLQGVESGRPVESYRPVRDELLWSLERDPVLKREALSSVAKFSYHLKGEEKSTYSSHVARLVVLEDMLANKYRKNIEEAIVEAISNVPAQSLPDNQKFEFIRKNDRAIAKLASGYVSHLTSSGFTKSAIILSANRRFFSSEIKRVRLEKVRKFFSDFVDQYSRFNVYFFTNKQTCEYLCSISAAEEAIMQGLPSHLSQKISDVLKTLEPEAKCVRLRERAKDIFGAANKAYSRINAYLAASVLSSWKLSLHVSESVVISTLNNGLSENYTVGHGDISVSRKVEVAVQTALNTSIKDAERLFDHINNHADENSKERVSNSFSIAYSAFGSQNAELQLITLWSAFEALLSAPPSGATSRIGHYGRLLVPCIAAHYAARNFVYVSNQLLFHDRGAYKSLTDAIKADGYDFSNRYEYLSLACAADEYRSLYEGLMEDCAHNPLLVNILVSLKERFSTPKKYLETIVDHERKVDWQISRIYRARNQIVHSGIVPKFAESVAVNAFEYLSTVLHAVVLRFKRGGGGESIDNIVELVAMNYWSSKEEVKRLAATDKFPTEDVRRLFASMV